MSAPSSPAGAKRAPIRVLIADHDPAARAAYREVLLGADMSGETAVFHNLRDRLFSMAAQEREGDGAPASTTGFEPTFCGGPQQAVAAVRDALAANQPFAVAYIALCMPEESDGLCAAARIRELDPAIEIVICVSPQAVVAADVGSLVPPEEKLSYLQMPFHPAELRQMTISLASKWRAEHRIVRLAYFDVLTGLPNREQARNRLQSALAGARQGGRTLAVLYLDLDNFKRINDTLGHGVGDQLLCKVASRLRHLLGGESPTPGAPPKPGDAPPAGDSPATGCSPATGDAPPGAHIARLGGDEFIVILPDIGTSATPGSVAARLIAGIQRPMRLGAHKVVVTPSVGIALFPTDGADVDSLLRNADLAMYFAKRKGPGTAAYFDPSMNTVALQRFTLEARLRSALRAQAFALHYQPQFDIASGALTGMEALLRWTDEELGPVPPAEFIPVAEETGLVQPIGEWVLRTACLQARHWHDEGLPLVRMAVNVSGQQFTMPEFPRLVAQILKESGIPPSMLELEITESVVMQDEERADRAIGELKALGVQLAIDDFGTGHSSLGRLSRFAVDRLKIDQSFIRRLHDRSDDQAIAAAIIAMSRSLRIDVIAEGVESFQQLLFLQQHDCQSAQGFLFSRALPAADARALLLRAAGSSGDTRTQRLRALIG